MILAIHGGAGVISRNSFTFEEFKSYEESLAKVLDQGQKLLNAGKSAIDIVTACVMALEDDPLFNAGRGSVFNSEGEVEMDASVMDSKLNWGAGVSGLKLIKNPILVAKDLLYLKTHSLLAGQKAEEWALARGLAKEERDYFRTRKRKEHYESFKKNQKQTLDHGGETHTVGAVCLDKEGHLAAATSTGGMTGKWSGRVSDSAIIGSGTWAHSETLAVSATGTGDIFIQENFCYQAHQKMLQGMNLKEALESSLERIKEKGGSGGAIAISRKGEVAMPFNSGGMFRGFSDGNKKDIYIF